MVGAGREDVSRGFRHTGFGVSDVVRLLVGWTRPIRLVGQLLNNNHIDKVEIDYTKRLDTETTLATPSKRVSYVDTETAQSKRMRM